MGERFTRNIALPTLIKYGGREASIIKY